MCIRLRAQNQIKIFPLNNAIAEELAPVIQSAINGEGEGGGNDNLTAPFDIVIDRGGRSQRRSGGRLGDFGRRRRDR